MIIELLVGGLLLIAILLVAKVNMKGGGDMAWWLWRKYPKYENLDKNTVGRLAGSNAIIRKEGGYCDIRYKTGLFSTEIDRDIPREFIKYIEPPETPIREGILRVYPYTIGKQTYSRIWDTYKDLIKLYEDNFKMLDSYLENLKDMMETKIDRRRMLEEVDSLTKTLSRLWENLKARKPEIVQYSIGTDTPKSDTKEEKKKE